MLVSSKKITFVEKFLKFKDAFVHSIMNNFVDISSIFYWKISKILIIKKL